DEHKVLQEYAGRELEEVSEEYREKIEKLRSYGLGLEKNDKKPAYEEIIEWLETHNGKMPVQRNSKDEKNLYQRWYWSDEHKILQEYTGKPIEEVPEEYREKIAKLREFGLGLEKSKLQQAKQARDEAKQKNSKAKELEQRVSEELKKRGKNYGEQ
ncbi:MAG: hypothetical protein J6O41_05735, partial [Clostridia bacterium]|nr:hypothetical protein [Clostridia bacterium]